MNPEVSVLLYPGCIFFEIALALEQLAAHYPIRFYTPEGESHPSSGGFQVHADGDYESLAQANAVAVLVPGGDPRGALTARYPVATALQGHLQRRALLAGICAGNLVLAYAGMLKGLRGTHNYTAEHTPLEKVDAAAHVWEGMHFERANLVRDGNVITAQPWAYRHYAAAVAEYLQVIDPAEASALATYVERRSYS